VPNLNNTNISLTTKMKINPDIRVSIIDEKERTQESPIKSCRIAFNVCGKCAEELVGSGLNSIDTVGENAPPSSQGQCIVWSSGGGGGSTNDMTTRQRQRFIITLCDDCISVQKTNRSN
jgi:hypothetical protein